MRENEQLKAIAKRYYQAKRKCRTSNISCYTEARDHSVWFQLVSIFNTNIHLRIRTGIFVQLNNSEKPTTHQNFPTIMNPQQQM